MFICMQTQNIYACKFYQVHRRLHYFLSYEYRWKHSLHCMRSLRTIYFFGCTIYCLGLKVEGMAVLFPLHLEICIEGLVGSRNSNYVIRIAIKGRCMTGLNYSCISMHKDDTATNHPCSLGSGNLMVVKHFLSSVGSTTFLQEEVQ